MYHCILSHGTETPLAEVSQTTTFRAESGLQVSAGIGPFEPSLATTWDGNITSFYFSTQVPSLSIEPLRTIAVNPVSAACSGADCISYLYTGGIASTSPYIFLVSQSPDADVFLIQGEVGLQGDYWNINPAEQPFAADHCQIWGDPQIAFSVCLQTSSLDSNSLIGGFNLYVCADQKLWDSVPINLVCASQILPGSIPSKLHHRSLFRAEQPRRHTPELTVLSSLSKTCTRGSRRQYHLSISYSS